MTIRVSHGGVKLLRLSKDLGLPLEVLRDVTAIVGRRGRGKTTTAVVLVEEAHRTGRRFCVVDPTGAWWGLRSSRDGCSPGIPCVVFGGKHAMAPLEPTAGKLLAEFVADPSQPSAVLDIKTWSRGEQVRFLSDFLSTLYQKNDAPLLLVLDEADQVAPQMAEPGERVMLGAAQRLVKLGRVSGFGVVLVTQRPATLNKNVMNMAGVLISLGLTGPQDHEAVFSWMKHRADAAKAKEILGSLPGLPQGRAWVWAPELDVLKLVDVRDRETFDSSATPDESKRELQPRALAEVDLAKLTQQIQATIERAKAEDPKELRRQVAELKRELAKKDAVLAEIDSRTKKIDASLDRVKAQKPREIAVLRDAQISRLEAQVHSLGVLIEAGANRMDKLGQGIGRTRDEILAALKAARREGEPLPAVQGRPLTPRATVGAAIPRPAPRPEPPRRTASAPQKPGNGDGRLGGPERKLLTILAQHHEGRTVRQLAVQAGYSQDGGGFRNPLGRIRSLGYVEPGDPVRITEAGRSILGDFEELPTGTALLDWWLGHGRLSGPEKKILRALAEPEPQSLSIEVLAERTGYEANGGGFRNPLGRLRTLELVTRGPIVRLSEELIG